MWMSYLTALVAGSHGRIAQPSWIRLTFFLMAQEMADTGDVESAVSHYQRAINTALKNKRWAEAWCVVRQLVACQERSDLWKAAQSNLSYYIQVFLLEHATDVLAQACQWRMLRADAWQETRYGRWLDHAPWAGLGKRPSGSPG